MNLIVYPYKVGSKSAKLLAAELEVPIVGRDGQIKGQDEFDPRANYLIVNWGSGYTPEWKPYSKRHVINHWDNVNLAVDKIASFKRFEEYGVKCPDFTTSMDTAMRWVREGSVVAARGKLEGRDGDGLQLIRDPYKLVRCPLYTKFVRAPTEFRVYVFDGKVIDVLEKRRDSERLAAGTVNEDIRTEQNGWVFCRWDKRGEKLEVAPDVHRQAKRAVASLGLVFGGVDVGWSREAGAVVYEVNTAPSIFGETVRKFARCIKEL